VHCEQLTGVYERLTGVCEWLTGVCERSMRPSRTLMDVCERVHGSVLDACSIYTMHSGELTYTHARERVSQTHAHRTWERKEEMDRCEAYKEDCQALKS
jgi:hypothetical protein